MACKHNELLGVISDTHGLLRPEAAAALKGCERIIHAGDLDDPSVITDLEKIAPVLAVRGNMDRGNWARVLPETLLVRSGDVAIYVIHDLSRLEISPVHAGIQAVIYGHSHKPAKGIEDGVLFLNPGSAGPRRFNLPICLARLKISGNNLDVEFIDLTQTYSA